MSNIDFSQMMMGDDARPGHQNAIKAVCKARILRHMPSEVQNNIAQAMSAFAVDVARGVSEMEALANAGLSAEDLPRARVGQRWIAAMRDTCRQLTKDASCNPSDDALWPTFPSDVASLVARF